MNRNSFKVGDRVRVYHGWRSFVGTVEKVVDLPNQKSGIFVIEDGFNSCHNDSPFHPKQCRRLKKKERMRIYFERADSGDCYSDVEKVWARIQRGQRIEFIEVKKK